MLVLQPGSSLELLNDASPRNSTNKKNQHSKLSVFARVLRGGWGAKSFLNLYRHKSSTNKLFNDSSDNKTGFVYGHEFFIWIDSDDRMTPETGQCQKMQAVGSGR